MPRTRPAYPAQYKAELVRLVREEGRTPASIWLVEFEPTGPVDRVVGRPGRDRCRRTVTDSPPMRKPS